MAPEADLLKEVPLFQFLDDQERAALAARMHVVSHPAGHLIFQFGEPGDALYVIAAGRAEAFFKNDTGEKIVLESAERGDFFGDLSLLDGGSRSASVMATEDVQLLRLDRKNLEEFLQRYPQAAMDLLAAMGRRLRATVERLRHTASRDVNAEVEDHRSAVQKSADWVAEFAGSLTFLFIHVIWFGGWIVVNMVPVPGIPQFDPFPFGFLTLTVSLEAIFLSVFVLLSQNRQAVKDRIRSDVEYDVNLKAELEIAHLHEKMDRLTCDMLARFNDLQERLGVGEAQGILADSRFSELKP
jgi:CRP/FNR family cyclic AMP-dependent transcriptional regulator